MNDLLAYYGLVDARISASEKDLTVQNCIFLKCGYTILPVAWILEAIAPMGVSSLMDAVNTFWKAVFYYAGKK